MLFGYIYIIFIVVTMFLVARDRKNSKKITNAEAKITTTPKERKIAFIIMLVSMIIHYIVGYLFEIDFINVITFGENGFTISFIGIILLFTTSIVIGNIVGCFMEKRERKEKQ